MVFNNPGGLRADIVTGGQTPFTLTHGILYSVLPFGNATVVGDMTGDKIARSAQSERHPVQGRAAGVGHPLRLLPLQRCPAWAAALGLGRLQHRGQEPLDRHVGAIAARPHLSHRHQRVPRPGRTGWLLGLQVRDQHLLLGRHARRRRTLGSQHLHPTTIPTLACWMDASPATAPTAAAMCCR